MPSPVQMLPRHRHSYWPNRHHPRTRRDQLLTQLPTLTVGLTPSSSLSSPVGIKHEPMIAARDARSDTLRQQKSLLQRLRRNLRRCAKTYYVERELGGSLAAAGGFPNSATFGCWLKASKIRAASQVYYDSTVTTLVKGRGYELRGLLNDFPQNTLSERAVECSRRHARLAGPSNRRIQTCKL